MKQFFSILAGIGLLITSIFIFAGEDSPSLPRHGGSLALNLNDDIKLTFGTDKEFGIEYDTVVTPDSIVFGLPKL